MDKAQLAREAQNLRDNEVFMFALDAMRSEAIQGLVSAAPTDAETIRNHQAKVHVVDELRGSIEAFIRSGQPKKTPGIA